MNEVLILILGELVSAAFVREVWTFEGRVTPVERCLLTVWLLLPVVGWLAAWAFLDRRARNVTDKSRDQGAVETNSHEPESFWLILTLGGFFAAVTLSRPRPGAASAACTVAVNRALPASPCRLARGWTMP